MERNAPTTVYALEGYCGAVETVLALLFRECKQGHALSGLSVKCSPVFFAAALSSAHQRRLPGTGMTRDEQIVLRRY